MPKAIVAIGGGEIRTKGTAAIDREIIRLSNKKNPKLLFIPTASSDSEEYWEHIQEYFGGFLKCKTDVLFLIKEHPSRAQIRKKIESADIIYVGGGNTLMMMRLWRRLGVDKLLYRRPNGRVAWFGGKSEFRHEQQSDINSTLLQHSMDLRQRSMFANSGGDGTISSLLLPQLGYARSVSFADSRRRRCATRLPAISSGKPNDRDRDTQHNPWNG